MEFAVASREFCKRFRLEVCERPARHDFELCRTETLFRERDEFVERDRGEAGSRVFRQRGLWPSRCGRRYTLWKRIGRPKETARKCAHTGNDNDEELLHRSNR